MRLWLKSRGIAAAAFPGEEVHMRKLALDLDSIDVQTFDTTAELPDMRGTVEAHLFSNPEGSSCKPCHISDCLTCPLPCP